MCGGGSYLSANDYALIFSGMGDACEPLVRVDWPSGAITERAVSSSEVSIVLVEPELGNGNR